MSYSDGNIGIVKDGTLDMCEFTVGEIVDNYFYNSR